MIDERLCGAKDERCEKLKRNPFTTKLLYLCASHTAQFSMTTTDTFYALVTGSSSGIGFQYARVMAEKKYNLLMVSNEEAIFEKAESIKEEFHVDAIPLMKDLGRQESAKELYDYCKEHNIPIDVIINNAGVYHDRDFVDDSPAFNTLILNLHMHTPAMLMYYFSKDMIERGRGYILNMSSVTSNIAVQRLATYGASKAFLKNFSRSTHIELYHKGVYVTTVQPGAVNTGLYNIGKRARKIGLFLGYIIEPERLAHKAVNAMFHRRASLTPGFINHVLLFLVALLPTSLLRLIRKWGLF